MIGQKAYSLKDKHAGLTPADVRPAKDALRPRIVATRGGAAKKKSAPARRAVAVKSNNDKK